MQDLTIYKGKKIFITGGAGIIGKELVKKLENIDAKIFVGDLKPRPKEFKKNIQYRRGDLNTLRVSEIKKFNPDIIFHLAATYERTAESFDFYVSNYQNNIKLSNYLLLTCKSLKNLKNFVFASSYLVYDEKLYLKKNSKKKIKSLNESDYTSTRNLIGSSKYYHENEIQFFSKYMKSCKFVIARIFRGYGKNSRDVISRWIKTAINNKKINVYGEEGSFDYVYSEDSAAALLSCIKCKQKITYLNVGSGKSIKIKQIIKILKNFFPKIKVSYIKKINTVEKSKADISKIRNYTNWRPQNSIAQGIKKIIDYEKNKKKK